MTSVPAGRVLSRLRACCRMGHPHETQQMTPARMTSALAPMKVSLLARVRFASSADGLSGCPADAGTAPGRSRHPRFADGESRMTSEACEWLASLMVGDHVTCALL